MLKLVGAPVWGEAGSLHLLSQSPHKPLFAGRIKDQSSLRQKGTNGRQGLPTWCTNESSASNAECSCQRAPHDSEQEDTADGPGLRDVLQINWPGLFKRVHVNKDLGAVPVRPKKLDN